MNLDVEIFTIRDLLFFFRRIRKILFRAVLVGALLGFSFAVKRSEALYEASATFVEAPDSGGGSLGSLQGLLGMGGGGAQPQILTLIKSNKVLCSLVGKMGLQAQVSQDTFILARPFVSLYKLFLAERGKPLPKVDPFLFRDVKYDQHEGLSFILRFSSRETFSLFSSDKSFIAEGRVGEPLVLSYVSFTLEKVPESLFFEFDYPLTISSWTAPVSQVKNRLKIQMHKTSKSLYELFFRDEDAERAAILLNAIMEAYRSYLKGDRDDTAKEQLAYLNRRQEDLFIQLGKSLDEYAKYVSLSLGNQGFMSVEQEINHFEAPYQKMLGRLFEIDLESLHLEDEKEPFYFGEEGLFAKQLNRIYREKEALSNQRDFLKISSLSPDQQLHFVENFKEVRQLEEQRATLDQLIASMETLQKIPSVDQFPEGINPLFCEWGKRLEGMSLNGREERDFFAFAKNSSHLLSLREKALHEQSLYGKVVPFELKGIDLETAKQLFKSYNHKLDEAEVKIRHSRSILEKLPEPDFELSSLGSVLLDPMSQTLIESASKTSLLLKDEKNHSVKEEIRLKEELALQKRILIEHVNQLIKVEEINEAVIKEKINGLQSLSLECTNQQISLLDNQVEEFLKKRRLLLKDEKIFFGKRLKEMREKMTHLPQKWKLENLLKLKTELGKSAMQAMTPIVESRTISHHLHVVGSKTLDAALTPGIPIKPLLAFFSLVGGLGSAFVTFLFLFSRTLLQGFPASYEKLKAMKYPVVGMIPSRCDGPEIEPLFFEPLRVISLFVKEQVVGLVSGQGPNYAHHLAEILGRSSRKVLLIECDFQTHSTSPGLLQALHHPLSHLPIQKAHAYDWMKGGGYTPFATEHLLSKSFSNLLTRLKADYDHILLFIRSPLEGSEARAALTFSQQIVVTVKNEPLEVLTPFATSPYHSENKQLIFVTCE